MLPILSASTIGTAIEWYDFFLYGFLAATVFAKLFFPTFNPVAGTILVVSAEVATEVTGPALLETWYELGRLATLPPRQEELDQARQYALGTLQLGMSTQAGLAGLASTYAGYGLRLEYLAEHAIRLAATTLEEVAAVSARHLAPAKAATVVLGDAERIEAPLAGLSTVERSTPTT